MWLLPVLVIGAIVAAVARPRASESLMLPAPPVAAGPGPTPGMPGPIAVLGQMMRVGGSPPPTLILCALAEAETLGREDIASDIIQVFVAPLVRQHQLQSMPGAFAPHERGTCERGEKLRTCSPREVLQTPPTAPSMPVARFATDEEIRAMLNADPRQFFEMAARGVIEVPIAQPPSPPPDVQAQPAAESTPTGLPPEVVAQMQDDAGLHEAADHTRSIAPGSPLVGVADDSWREFVMRLEREPASFNSSKHVGQYRQRRERLAEIGIDPRAILGSAQAQRMALDADLVDAHHHAVAAGMLEAHLGRTFTVPGHDEPQRLSLSGALGVIQFAGVEGAIGWLEHYNDRKRFPHTTQAFLRTNGVF